MADNKLCLPCISLINGGSRMKCPKCNHEYDDSKFCPECGTPASFFCSKCGKEHSQKFCPECGTPVAELMVTPPQAPPPTPEQNVQQPNIIINNSNTNTNANMNYGGVRYPQKSKITALLLCIFLGYLGGHCFYTGKTGMGIIYLFTAGLCGVGVIIDLIRIITGSYTDKFGQPLL